LTGALREYCSDLAEESRGASALPFIGREREVTAVLETLCRKLKSNPLLIGKPGVGKSALVAAVSARLCEGRNLLALGQTSLEVSRLVAGRREIRRASKGNRTCWKRVRRATLHPLLRQFTTW
jgi:ATP-dependent Clp protease ATP-binding subunit ClpA